MAVALRPSRVFQPAAQPPHSPSQPDRGRLNTAPLCASASFRMMSAVGFMEPEPRLRQRSQPGRGPLPLPASRLHSPPQNRELLPLLCRWRELLYQRGRRRCSIFQTLRRVLGADHQRTIPSTASPPLMDAGDESVGGEEEQSLREIESAPPPAPLLCENPPVGLLGGAGAGPGPGRGRTSLRHCWICTGASVSESRVPSLKQLPLLSPNGFRRDGPNTRATETLG
ncbi:unnamed protein product [Lota lota]